MRQNYYFDVDYYIYIHMWCDTVTWFVYIKSKRSFLILCHHLSRIALWHFIIIFISPTPNSHLLTE